MAGGVLAALVVIGVIGNIGSSDSKDKNSTPITIAETTTTAPTTTSAATTTTTSAAPSNPGNSKNCGDFSTWLEAQAWFDTYFPYYGDVGRLDGNNDGVACESLPGAP